MNLRGVYREYHAPRRVVWPYMARNARWELAGWFFRKLHDPLRRCRICSKCATDFPARYRSQILCTTCQIAAGNRLLARFEEGNISVEQFISMVTEEDK